jgi:hypothetical protein
MWMSDKCVEQSTHPAGHDQVYSTEHGDTAADRMPTQLAARDNSAADTSSNTSSHVSIMHLRICIVCMLLSKQACSSLPLLLLPLHMQAMVAATAAAAAATPASILNHP